MAYRVRFRPRAEQDLEAIYRYLIQEAPLRGPQWIDGLEEALYSLREAPQRCPVVRVFSRPTVAVRKLLHGRYPHVYRVYFNIEATIVWILHIRHGARKEPQRRELFE
jgi:plasmid stabilization system protein ParE